MCGIAGIIDESLDEGAIATALEPMRTAIRYRGPDDEGVLAQHGVGLAHARLSIRDLSAAGRCPMPGSEGRIHVVLNGEIYNWRELRDELASIGREFRSWNDSEVIACGLEEWGVALLPRLRGMFAFAAWDSAARRLMLARDRMGEKPLYYASEGRSIRFASNPAALIAGRTFTLDCAALRCYLAHSFIPSTHTAFEGVKVLPPASSLEFGVDAQPKIRVYWRLPRSVPVRATDAEREAAMVGVLQDSVDRCLDADVPVGVFLSGGVDSSVVAALAGRSHPHIAAFSLGFEEAEQSELPYATAVATHLGLPHHKLVATQGDVLEHLVPLVERYGQPFADPSALATHLVSQLARREVKVCLSGDGGDEAFAGYWRVQARVHAARYRAIVPAVWSRRLAAAFRVSSMPLLRRFAALNALAAGGPGGAYTNSQSWFDGIDAVCGPRLAEAAGHDSVACRVGTSSDTGDHRLTVIQAVQLEDYRVQLPDAYLVKVDVASMAAGLEVRAPLLEQRVVESAWMLPDDAKLRWGRRKWLLRRIAARLVPASAIERPKQGFGLPLQDWFRGELGSAFERLWVDSRLAADQMIDFDVVTRALAEHRRGARHEHRLWSMLWLEVWYRMFVVGETRETVVEDLRG